MSEPQSNIPWTERAILSPVEKIVGSRIEADLLVGADPVGRVKELMADNENLRQQLDHKIAMERTRMAEHNRQVAKIAELERIAGLTKGALSRITCWAHGQHGADCECPTCKAIAELNKIL